MQMPKKPKISTEEKISAVESYLHGELSQRHAAQKVGVKIAPFQRWLRIIVWRGRKDFSLIQPRGSIVLLKDWRR